MLTQTGHCAARKETFMAGQIGELAQDFTLMDGSRNQVSLSEFLNKKNIVLAFYVLAFTGG
jgi:peroxiredoxin